MSYSIHSYVQGSLGRGIGEARRVYKVSPDGAGVGVKVEEAPVVQAERGKIGNLLVKARAVALAAGLSLGLTTACEEGSEDAAEDMEGGNEGNEDNPPNDLPEGGEAEAEGDTTGETTDSSTTGDTESTDTETGETTGEESTDTGTETGTETGGELPDAVINKIEAPDCYELAPGNPFNADYECDRFEHPIITAIIDGSNIIDCVVNTEIVHENNEIEILTTEPCTQNQGNWEFKLDSKGEEGTLEKVIRAKSDADVSDNSLDWKAEAKKVGFYFF